MIPNIAWTYWAQGREGSNDCLELCEKSWRDLAGFEEVHVLSQVNLRDYLNPSELPPRFELLPVQFQSDLVRLNLLAKYGGIWLDTSTLVTRNVAAWLQSLDLGEGLFLFRNHNGGIGGRLFEIGFIAAEPGHPFIVSWADHLERFFRYPRVHGAHSQFSTTPSPYKKVFGLLNRFLRRSAGRSAWWARFPLRLLPFYPYFITYYIANRLLQTSSYRDLLERIPFYDARLYLRLRKIVSREGWKALVKNLEDQSVPIHDLEFRQPMSNSEKDSLNRFMNHVCSSQTDERSNVQRE